MMTTYMHPTYNLSKDDKINKVDQKVYKGMIGSLLYITTYNPRNFVFDLSHSNYSSSLTMVF